MIPDLLNMVPCMVAHDWVKCAVQAATTAVGAPRLFHVGVGVEYHQPALRGVQWKYVCYIIYLVETR